MQRREHCKIVLKESKVIIYGVRLNTGNVILHVHVQVLYNTCQHRHCWKVFVFIFNDKSLKYLSGIYCFLWRPKVIWMLDFIIRRLFLWRHNVAKTLTSQSQNESIKVGIFSCFRILMLWFFKDLNGWLLSVHFQILRPWY